jgi:hypothetical protein
MSSHSETTPIVAARVAAGTWKKWLLTAGCLTGCALAMIGWTAGFGWDAIELLKWLLA